MPLWPLNPLFHLQTPVHELVGYSVRDLQACGVTYEQMRQAGITPGLMQTFHFSLQEWMQLGFAHDHVVEMNEMHCRMLFGTTMGSVLSEMLTLAPL